MLNPPVSLKTKLMHMPFACRFVVSSWPNGCSKVFVSSFVHKTVKWERGHVRLASEPVCFG